MYVRPLQLFRKFGNIQFLNGCRSLSRLSYMHHVEKNPLSPLTIGQVLEITANKYGDREAIVSCHQEKRYTFGEIYNQADKLAAGLHNVGLEKGDRLGLWAPNLTEWYIAMMACARAGLILIPLNPAYQTPEIEYCINKVGIKGIICDYKFKSQNYYEMLKQICPELDSGEPGKLNSVKAPTLKAVIIISQESLKGTFGYEEILSLGDTRSVNNIRILQDKIDPDECCNVQFTSGTTGKPKAAMLSHLNIINNAYRIGRRNELGEKHHKICVQVPLFHAFGLCITAMAALHFGTTLVLPAASYNPYKSLEAIKNEKCTTIHGTPTMYVDLVRVQKEKNESISPEIAVCGGSPCSPKLFEQMLDELKLKKVKSIYGLTETTGVVFQSLPHDDRVKSISTVGYIHEHLEVKVVDEQNNIVPFGTPGELCVRGYCNMLGYWEDEEKTKEMLGRDGWLKTGDQFILEEDGYGKVVGRLKEMIIRGGENIFPREIEDFLNTHPAIMECHVVGIPHERLGEEVCACVRLKEGTSLTHEDLVKFCKGQIAHFKIPSVLRIMEEFPKTTSGKIQKFKLMADFKKHSDCI